MASTSTLLERGTEVAGFRVESLLGEGGMGTVYLATQIRLDREVALKVLSPERSQDPEFQERFVRESKLAASLDHPNVLPVYDAGEADGVIYLAMRYVQGGDLRHLLQEHGRLPAILALGITRQVALALDGAHRAGLVHRDVKPANILLTGDDHAYLADFGLARSKSARRLTRTGVFMGTPDYAAPEQLEGIRAVDGRADIYSLGCVLYHCLVGQPPYVRESEIGVINAHLQDPPPTLSQVRPDLPVAISGIVQRAMAKAPSERYRSGADLAAELASVLEELGVEAGSVALSAGDASTNPVEVVESATAPGRRGTETVLDRVEAQTPIALEEEPRKRHLRLGRVLAALGRPLLKAPQLARRAVVAVGRPLLKAPPLLWRLVSPVGRSLLKGPRLARESVAALGRPRLSRPRLSKKSVAGVVGVVFVAGGAAAAVLLTHNSAPVASAQLRSRVLKPAAITGVTASDKSATGRGYDRRVSMSFYVNSSKRRPVTSIKYQTRTRSSGSASKTLKSASSPVFVSGLRNGKRYRFRLRACNKKGCGAWSQWSNPVRPFGRPPSPKVSAAAQGSDIVIRWSARRLDGRPITRIVLDINGKLASLKWSSRQPKVISVGYSWRGSIRARVVDSTGWRSAWSATQRESTPTQNTTPPSTVPAHTTQSSPTPGSTTSIIPPS